MDAPPPPGTYPPSAPVDEGKPESAPADEGKPESDHPLAALDSGPTGVRRLLAAVVESSDDAIYAKTLDGVILTWNSGAERIFGYARDEIVGSKVSVLAPPNMEDDLSGILERLRRGERIQQYETDRMSRHGHRLRVSLTISPIRNDEGEIIGASSIARDITGVRRAEARRALLVEVVETLASVLDAEEVLRRLARLAVRDLADYCVAYLLEPGGEIRRVGLAHGDPARASLVHRLVDARPPRLDDDVGAGAVIRTGRPMLAAEVSLATLERAAGGVPGYLDLLRELGPVSSMVLPLKARGRTVGAVAFATTRRSGVRYTDEDLEFASHLADRAGLALDNARLYSGVRGEAERREAAEVELRRRYEQLRTLYRMTEAVARAGSLQDIYDEALVALRDAVHLDRAGVLRFGAEEGLRFVAWHALSESYRAEVERHPPWPPDARDPEPILIADVETAALEAPLRRAVLSEGIRSLAFIPLSFGGRLLGKFALYLDRPHEFASDEMELARTVAGTITFAIVRMEDEKRVRAAKEAAERANQAKSQFLGVMSHELRTPLNSVVGYADLLLMEAKGPVNQSQRQYIERIKRSASHQLRLVEEILDYARLEAGREDVHLVPTDVRRSVADVIQFVRPEAKRKGLPLRRDLPETPVWTLTDPARLRQILLNLAGNAVKFTEEGEVSVTVRVEEGWLSLAVGDTGPGIPEEKLEQIWEPFAQGSDRADGTGLGLAIARRFVELLGGELAVESRPGQGSTFTVRIPHREVEVETG